MGKFPIDAPIGKVKAALKVLGFDVVREGNHIALARDNDNGTRTTLTIPNHDHLKSSTLRTILTRAGIDRDAFLDAYEQQ